MLIFLDRLFNALAGEIDQYLVLPLLYHFGWMQWEELSFDWVLVCVYGMFASSSPTPCAGRWRRCFRSSTGKIEKQW